MKENKKSVTYRINPETLKKYDEKLTTIYHTPKHRKKSIIIEELLNQFNKQDNKILEQHIYTHKDLINLQQEPTKQENTQQQTIKQQEQKIQQLQQENTKLENLLNNITQNQNNQTEKYEERIEKLEQQLTTKEKENKTKYTDYKHMVEIHNKLQNEYNELQNENKQLTNTITEIKKMSLLERIIGKYPNPQKEIQGE